MEARICADCGAAYAVVQPSQQGELCPRCAAAARDRRRRERRRERGLCTRCGVRPAREGRATCAECIRERVERGFRSRGGGGE